MRQLSRYSLDEQDMVGFGEHVAIETNVFVQTSHPMAHLQMKHCEGSMDYICSIIRHHLLRNTLDRGNILALYKSWKNDHAPSIYRKMYTIMSSESFTTSMRL